MTNLRTMVTAGLAALVLASGCAKKIDEFPGGSINSGVYYLDVTPPCAPGSVEVLGFHGDYAAPEVKCKSSKDGKELVCIITGRKDLGTKAFECVYAKQ